MICYVKGVFLRFSFSHAYADAGLAMGAGARG